MNKTFAFLQLHTEGTAKMTMDASMAGGDAARATPGARHTAATPTPPPRLRRFQRHGMVTQLMALEAVVRLGSATHAAQALCIAQPTLSGHLRKLSEALDVRLFDLQGKRLVPTPAAMVLLDSAREVFDAFERCEARLARCRPAGQNS